MKRSFDTAGIYIMPEVGLEGQLKLKRARVLADRHPELGAPLDCTWLSAGVGHLGWWI